MKQPKGGPRRSQKSIQAFFSQKSGTNSLPEKGASSGRDDSNAPEVPPGVENRNRNRHANSSGKRPSDCLGSSQPAAVPVVSDGVDATAIDGLAGDNRQPGIDLTEDQGSKPAKKRKFELPKLPSRDPLRQQKAATKLGISRLRLLPGDDQTSAKKAPGSKYTPLEKQVIDLKRKHSGIVLLVEVCCEWPSCLVALGFLGRLSQTKLPTFLLPYTQLSTIRYA
jgi:hypothetical protein